MLGPICAFLSSVTWAFGSSGYSALTREHSPFAVNLARSFVAFPCFVAVILISSGFEGALQEVASLGWQRMGWFTLSILASYGIGDVLFYLSAAAIGVPSSLAIASAYPLITAVFGVIFLGESLSGLRLLGLILTVAGVILVILSGSSGRIIGDASRRRIRAGVLLAFATAICWSINTYSVAQGGKGVSPNVASAARMLIALGACSLLGAVLDRKRSLLLPMPVVTRNLWLFFIEGFGGSLFFMYGLSRSPLALGAPLASLAPVLAVPAAWVMGVERPSARRTFAVMTVVSGLCLLLLSKQ